MIPASAMSRHASWNGPIGSLGSGVPITATRIAIPSTAPIWRTQPMIAPPVAKRDGASSATAALPQAEKLRPTPSAGEEQRTAGSPSRTPASGRTDAAMPSAPSAEEQAARERDDALAEAVGEPPADQRADAPPSAGPA